VVALAAARQMVETELLVHRGKAMRVEMETQVPAHSLLVVVAVLARLEQTQ
jgi:hypothetical protein